MDILSPVNTLSTTHVSQAFFMTDCIPNAYVRAVVTENGKGFAVCAADGSQLAVFPTFEAAFYGAKLHDLEPAKALH